MRKDLKLPSLYKTLLLLAMVIGPIYWLVLTQDGQRRTDLALMYILGKPDLNAALDRFRGGTTESELRESFPDIELECAAAPSPFGDRLCAAEIGSFDRIPARSVTLFFAGDGLRAVKVLYQPAYHDLMRWWVERRVAKGAGEAESPPVPDIDKGVASWVVYDGVLLLKDGELADGDEPSLFWLSGAALEARAPPGAAD
jgi:hypothetical protein